MEQEGMLLYRRKSRPKILKVLFSPLKYHQNIFAIHPCVAEAYDW